MSDAENDDSLEFRIRAVTLPGSPELIDGRDDTLQNGEEVLSSIPLGTFATFPFVVDEASTVRVSVGETGVGGGRPFLQVFDPSGSLVGSDSNLNDASFQFTTLQTGTFTAVVSDAENDDPLEFQIIATGISDDQPVSTLLGDINLDGAVDFSDISPFIAVLSSGGFQAEADIDVSGMVDFSDISPFIAILSSASPAVAQAIGSGFALTNFSSLEQPDDETAVAGGSSQSIQEVPEQPPVIANGDPVALNVPVVSNLSGGRQALRRPVGDFLGNRFADGGTEDDTAIVLTGSVVDALGGEFLADGLEFDSLVSDEAVTNADRDVVFSELLADGKQFSFNGNFGDVLESDFIDPLTTRTVAS